MAATQNIPAGPLAQFRKVGDMVLHKSGTVHCNTTQKWFGQLKVVYRFAVPMAGMAAAGKLVLLT
jgi:hypothetical protein